MTGLGARQALGLWDVWMGYSGEGAQGSERGRERAARVHSVAKWAAKDGKWGLLDNKGNVLTEFIYQGAYDFTNGYARVMLNDKVGVVNKTGKLIVPIEYKSLGSIYKNTILGIKPAETVFLNLK